MQNTFNITISLIIHTNEPFERVSQIMGVSQSKDLRRRGTDGKLISAPKAWVYRMRFKQQTDIEPCIRKFVSHFSEFSTRISEVKKIGDCTIRMSIVTLYAQIGVSLSPQNLQALGALNIPFEITLFSYGNCLDNG